MGQSANQNAGYDTSDLESSYAYGFMGVLTISIIMTVFIVSGLFAFLTDFESGGKVVDAVGGAAKLGPIGWVAGGVSANVRLRERLDARFLAD